MKYILFHKPYGVLCQFTDAEGRPTLKDYIPIPNIYAVGRLDIDSEGLLLLTDDGSLNQELANPRAKQFKTYWAQVEGIPTEEQLEKLRGRIRMKDYVTLPAQVRLLGEEIVIWPRPKPIRFRKTVPTTWIELKIQEGKNHQVKKMTAAVGLPCLRLIRVAIGPIKLGPLKPGEYKTIKKPSL